MEEISEEKMEGEVEKAHSLAEIAEKNDYNTWKISFAELDRILKRAGVWVHYYANPPQKRWEKTQIVEYDENEARLLKEDGKYFGLHLLINNDEGHEGQYKFDFHKAVESQVYPGNTFSPLGHVFVDRSDAGKYFVTNIRNPYKGRGRSKSRRKKYKLKKSRRKTRR
jgi:hypothetical protein